MEFEVRATAFAVVQVCEYCNEGEFIPNGDNSYVPDIKIGHVCNFCGETAYFQEKFPAIRHRIEREDMSWKN